MDPTRRAMAEAHVDCMIASGLAADTPGIRCVCWELGLNDMPTDCMQSGVTGCQLNCDSIGGRDSAAPGDGVWCGRLRSVADNNWVTATAMGPLV